MPPIRKYTRDDIIDVTKNLVLKEGLGSINARRIAKELNCSVQPIFHNFASMDDLKSEVFKEIYHVYREFMKSGENKENPYKEMGLSYIKFARDYPEFFKLIFMQETNLNVEKFLMSDNTGEEVVRVGQNMTGLSFQEQKKFHIKVWMFTHGIACFLATKTIKISDLEIEELLKSTVREMLIGYKKEGSQNEKSN